MGTEFEAALCEAIDKLPASFALEPAKLLDERGAVVIEGQAGRTENDPTGIFEAYPPAAKFDLTRVVGIRFEKGATERFSTFDECPNHNGQIHYHYKVAA